VLFIRTAKGTSELKKITLLFNTLLLLTLSLPAFSTPINLHDFFADPSVTVANDGLSALIKEDAMLPSVLLINDPSYGDPEVIIAGNKSILTLDFDFTEGVFNNDELFVSLFDANTFTVLEKLSSHESIVTSFIVDLSLYVGMTLGFQIELKSFDNLFDSTVNISSLTLSTEQVNSIPEPHSLAIFCAALLLLTLFPPKLGVIND
jgi:hypothetical protein